MPTAFSHQAPLPSVPPQRMLALSSSLALTLGTLSSLAQAQPAETEGS